MKNGAVFLAPFLSYFGMVDAKLVQVAQYGYTRNLRQVLDHWNVRAIKIFEGSVYNGDEEEWEDRWRS